MVDKGSKSLHSCCPIIMYFKCTESLCEYTCVMSKALYIKHYNTQPNLTMQYVSHSIPSLLCIHTQAHTHTHTHKSSNPTLPPLSQCLPPQNILFLN